jgi:hypothetical protein
MINRKLVMVVLGALAASRRAAPDAKLERVATQWANKLGRFEVLF